MIGAVVWADGSKARPPMTRGDGLRVGRDTENTFMSFHVAGSMSVYTARCSVLLIWCDYWVNIHLELKR